MGGVVFLIFIFCVKLSVGERPNIVLIIGDDMGWNDVGYHGSNQIQTPNIDALGYNGIILNRFYTQQSCTPSRAALLTGNYPIRSGMQGYPLKGGENRHLPLDMPVLPEYLKTLGYETHLIGKWHLGYAYKKVTPIGRGFDSHFGYWNGFVSYFDYEMRQDNFEGFDLRDMFEPAWEFRGRYATDLFTKKAVEVIENHDQHRPLFLMVSHLAAHTGRDGTELEIPDRNETNQKYAHVRGEKRRLYAGVVERLDHSVGQIVKALSEQNLLENSIIIYISDNGGQTVGLHENSASNWPLRGLKFTLLEGGVRAVGVAYSPKFDTNRGTISNELMHITDWLPTFYSAAGGDVGALGELDGVDQWEVLTGNAKSNRNEILLDFDEKMNMSGIIGYEGRYKLINGTYQGGTSDEYFGETGRGEENPPYDLEAVLNSEVNVAIRKLNAHEPLTVEKIRKLREDVDLKNCRDENPGHSSCTGICLFDLHEDPCETENVVEDHPDVLEELKDRLATFRQFVVSVDGGHVDPKSNPEYFNNTWASWMDVKNCGDTVINEDAYTGRFF